MILGRIMIILNILVCFLVPPAIIIRFLMRKIKVVLPMFMGIASFGVAILLIKNLVEKYVFNNSDFLYNLKFTFFGDVIFNPGFETFVIIAAAFVFLQIARCGLSKRKTIAFALGYAWVANSYSCGQYIMDLLFDWIRNDSAIYVPSALTLFVQIITIVITAVSFIGISFVLQTGINCKKQLKYTLIAFGLLFVYNLFYPLCSNWICIPYPVILILKCVLAGSFFYIGYRWFSKERHTHAVSAKSKHHHS